MRNYSEADPLWRVRAYRLAAELLAGAWDDALALERNPITRRLAAQLYDAVGSISANLGEGYGRSSGRDRVRLFEYALGSVREAVVWYQAAAPVLGEEATDRRLVALEEIRRILLAVIPRERGRTIRRARGSPSAVRS